MANPDNPFGLTLIQAEGKECRVRVYAKDTSAAIYPGDVVKLQAAGDVIVAASGDAMVGVAAEYKAAADTSISVYDDPNAVFIAQTSGSFAAADVGLNISTLVAAGDATLKQSNHSLDTATAGTTATLQWKILGLYSKGENAVGANAIVRVRPNNHIFKSGTGTSGV